jgi:hypothetical protein
MTEQKQLNVDSQRRFRATHRRIDYAPRPAIWAIIEQHFMGARVKSLTGVINKLIVAGHEAITGNLDELDIAGTPGAEHTVEIQHQPLTSRQEKYAFTVATSNQSLTASYRAVYTPKNAKPGTVNKMAAELAALPHVAARIRAIREGVTATALREAGYSLADAMRQVGELFELAMHRGQIGTAVRALVLRARLSGLLPSSKKRRGWRDAPQSDLTDAERASLIEIRDKVLAEMQQTADARELEGGPSAETLAPFRRVIE